MGRYRLGTLMVAAAGLLTLLTLAVCLALSVVTDIMAARAEHLVLAATHADRTEVVRDVMRIENWSRTGDYIAYGVGAFVLLGSAVVIAISYLWVFRPLIDLANAMKAFTMGERERRAQPSPAVELDSAAKAFNTMADIITGQHARLLEFLSGAAQELRDPVQVMKAALQVFSPGKPLPPEQLIHSRLALASREVERLERMVQTYLDAGRTEWMRLDLQLGRNDVRETVREVATMYESYSPVHLVKVATPPEPMWVCSNAPRLSQVFYTLVANAIQRSPRGGVVMIAARKVDHRGVVEVTDHGVGIPKEEMGHLFEPFQISREHQTGPGTSVGMSVAQRIVEAHKGTIEVSSTAGEGSTFRVCLPLTNETSIESVKKVVAPSPSLAEADGHGPHSQPSQERR